MYFVYICVATYVRMYIYKCMYACIYVCMYVATYASNCDFMDLRNQSSTCILCNFLM